MTDPVRTRTCTSAAAAIALLDQAAKLVESIDDRTYSTTSSTMMNGTIGKHLRHCLDHFGAALAPLTDPGASIDYDRRERNVPMEADRQEAIRCISAVRSELARIDVERSTAPVTIRVLLTAGGDEATMGSTLERELAFASHHAVHHHAMIKVIADELGVATPEGFGMAPATIEYERALAAPTG